MDETDGLRDALLEELNRLGFALTESTASGFTLTRLALESCLFLTIEPMGSDEWLVGLETRSNSLLGRLPEPTMPFALGRFGPSPDGMRLALSSEDVEKALPTLLENAILPVLDMATG